MPCALRRASRATPAVSCDGHEAAGCELRRSRAASHADCELRWSRACDQVIVHTEHTLGLSPRCVFVRLSVSLPSFDCPLIASLKSAKNLYLSHRIFDKIRQIYRFFDAFRQKLQILCRNQARLIKALHACCCSLRNELLATHVLNAFCARSA